ncbi:MAG: hypothetical protein MJE66_20125 [Proteobacteria bacterium]|nr:hypothetical protein [Pseudomonadota bacterium]
MQAPFELIFAIAMLAAVLVGLVAWLRILFFGWKALANRRQDVDISRDAPLGNPVNVLFSDALLTERGLAYRRKMTRAMMLFAATLVVGFAAAALIGAIAGIAAGLQAE